LTDRETVSLSIRTVICVVNYLFYDSPIILPASTKQSIARQFLMLDRFMTGSLKKCYNKSMSVRFETK